MNILAISSVKSFDLVEIPLSCLMLKLHIMVISSIWAFVCWYSDYEGQFCLFHVFNPQFLSYQREPMLLCLYTMCGQYDNTAYNFQSLISRVYHVN